MCLQPDCAATECTETEDAAHAACGAAHGAGQATCDAVSGCTYAAGAAPPAAADCTAIVVDTTASPDLCPTGCSYTAPDATATPAIVEACAESAADATIASAATLEVVFKGRSPNFDVCSGAECLNFKFGKIEERGPDGVRKVNAHSIMSLASRNNLPTWSSGITQYGSSSAVTFVKMVLDGDFRRGCSNSGRDGGAADPSATRNRSPRQRAVVQIGEMVAQMPAQAMIGTSAQPAAQVTNITVQATHKGMEFIFPAFTSAYYDPVIAEEASFASCSTCAPIGTDEVVTVSGGDTTADDTPAAAPRASGAARVAAAAAGVVLGVVSL